MKKTYTNVHRKARKTTSKSTRKTPQSRPIPGKQQVRNEAGGYVFEVTPWVALDRFLVLGTESGSYYVEEQKLTREMAKMVEKCIALDGPRVVQRIVEISQSGRAPKNDPALFALAMCSGLGDENTRSVALVALPEVARTGTHLFSFLEYVKQFRGWGRGLRTAISTWYTNKEGRNLVYQLLKYQARDGWSHRDVLRLAHPVPRTPTQDFLFKTVMEGFAEASRGFESNIEASVAEFLVAVELLKSESDPGAAAALIVEHRLPREVVPTELLNSKEVWGALLEEMPYTALVRNLGKMTSVGLLGVRAAATRKVLDKLQDSELLRKARVHPFALLVALKTYESGQGYRGSNVWTPVTKVVDALNDAFYASFETVEPSGQRLLLGIDWSGSMGYPEIGGMPGITPAVGAAAMGLVTAATEPDTEIVCFATSIKAITLSPKMRLDEAVRVTEKGVGEGTDCSVPIKWALKNKVPVDAFVIYTDNQTWYGREHPVQALKNYRDRMGIPAKLVVVGMVANRHSIGDEKDDAGTLNVVGFDTATPQLISGFVGGW